MSNMGRSSVQVLYQYLPGAVFEHPEFGLCKVTEVRIDQIRDLNVDSLFCELSHIIHTWGEKAELEYPNPDGNADDYIIGTPTEVLYEPFPLVLRCLKCRRVYDYARIKRKPRQCVKCAGSLTQIPYVQIHECGRLESIYANQTCSSHGIGDLILEDSSGRFATVQWQCIGQGCNNRYVSQLQKTPCRCVWGKKDGYEQFLRNARYNDSSVFMSRLFSYVNVPADKLRVLSSSDDMRDVCVGRALGIIDADNSPSKPVSAEINISQHEIAALCSEIEALENLYSKYNDPEIGHMIKEKRQKLQPLNQQDNLQKVRSLIKSERLDVLRRSRKILEIAALLNNFVITDSRQIYQTFLCRGDKVGAIIVEEAEKLYSKLGFSNMLVVHDFPLALAAIGYARGRGGRGEASLKAFPPYRDTAKTPIYVVTAQTEAIFIQLNPVAVIEWLVDNNMIDYPGKVDKDCAWSVLHDTAIGLASDRAESDLWNHSATKNVRILLHTVSHVLLRKLDWSGFDPESIGEYLIPEALTLLLFANSFSSFTLGGLTTLYEQRLHQWLVDALTQGGNCIYDPICEDQGGACSGCLHRRFNCQYFNDDLSRLYLFGGVLPDGAKIRGFWQGTHHEY